MLQIRFGATGPKSGRDSTVQDTTGDKSVPEEDHVASVEQVIAEAKAWLMAAGVDAYQLEPEYLQGMSEDELQTIFLTLFSDFMEDDPRNEIHFSVINDFLAKLGEALANVDDITTIFGVETEIDASGATAAHSEQTSGDAKRVALARMLERQPVQSDLKFKINHWNSNKFSISYQSCNDSSVFDQRFRFFGNVRFLFLDSQVEGADCREQTTDIQLSRADVIAAKWFLEMKPR